MDKISGISLRTTEETKSSFKSSLEELQNSKK